MAVIAVVALALALALAITDAVRMRARAARYRRIALSHERLVRTLRAIDGWDEELKVRMGVVYPASNEQLTPHYDRMMKMIPFIEGLKQKYEYAAEHPRFLSLPDPFHQGSGGSSL